MRKPGRDAVGRGAVFLAGAGAALGGMAGTVDWPFVGTLFGTVEGATVGALVGSVDGLVLGALLAGVRSKWPARAVSAGLALLVELLGVRIYRGPIDVPVAVEAALVVLGVVAAAAVGPLVAYGLAPAAGVPVEPIPTSRRPSRVSRRIVTWGACVGAGIGAVAGLVIGVRTYLLTSPFAAVEGAVFGSVTGVMLACLTVGIAVLPRLRARR